MDQNTNIHNPGVVDQYDFALVGVHKGKTMLVNGHEFVDGHFSIRCNGEQAKGLTNLFSCYGAFPADQAEALQAEFDLAAALDGKAAPTETVAAAVGTTDKTDTSVVEQKPTLAEAIAQLDPENDAHWTSNNLPGLDDLSRLTGETVTRAQVNEIAEGFTRAKAKAARA